MDALNSKSRWKILSHRLCPFAVNHFLIALLLRKRVRKRRTFARFPQSCMWHHCRLLFRLVSSNSQPHSSPPHSRRRDKSPVIKNSAADCAIDHSIRSNAASPPIHSHLNPLSVLISLSFFRALSNSSFTVSRSMLRGTRSNTAALKMR